MTFAWIIDVSTIISLCSFLGSIVMFILTIRKKKETKDYAKNANAYNEAARKYYDLMVERLNTESNVAERAIPELKKASCDANIVKAGTNKWILKIFNKGNANATNVSFKFLGDNAPPVLGTFPIKLLEPQRNYDSHIIIYSGLGDSGWDYQITWTNDNGTNDNKLGVLTLPLT